MSELYTEWLGSAEHPDLIWWDLLSWERKDYQVEVRRTDEYRATLHLGQVNHMGTEFTEVVEPIPVDLSYGAIFGPDESDVEEWSSLAARIVEEINGSDQRVIYCDRAVREGKGLRLED